MDLTWSSLDRWGGVFHEPWVDPDEVFDGLIDAYESRTSRSLVGVEEGVAFIAPSPRVEFGGLSDELGGVWTFLMQQYLIILYQDIQLSSGETVTGWSRFGSAEPFNYDTDRASVHIGDGVIWDNDVQDIGSPDDDWGEWRVGEWEQWSYTAETDGVFRLGLSARQDDQVGSTGYFRDIRVLPVPEGGRTAMLLSFGMVAFILARRRRVKLR